MADPYSTILNVNLILRRLGLVQAFVNYLIFLLQFYQYDLCLSNPEGSGNQNTLRHFEEMSQSNLRLVYYGNVLSATIYSLSNNLSFFDREVLYVDGRFS